MSKLEQGISLFNGEVETVIQSITEASKNIKSMVDRHTANIIESLKEQAQKESERLVAIFSDHKTALDTVHALDIRNRSISGQSRHHGTVINLLKNLQKDIVYLEDCSLPDFPSATYMPKFVYENDISQLIGTCEICVTKLGTERRMNIVPIRIPPGILYICRCCGKEKIKKYNERFKWKWFNCCQGLMVKK